MSTDINRDAIRDVLLEICKFPRDEWASNDVYEAWINKIALAISPDPRIEQIKVLCAETYHWIDGTDTGDNDSKQRQIMSEPTTMDINIDTSKGWTELETIGPDSTYQLAEFNQNGKLIRAWRRNTKPTNLPTTPYTVIQVTWTRGDPNYDNILTLHPDGLWNSRVGHAYREPEISDYKTVATPTSETVK